MIGIDVSIIKMIQSLRNPVFDYLFYGITQLGDKFVFMGIVAILYWTYNKRFAYKFLFAYLGSAVVNSVLKVIVRRPRPYVEGATFDAEGNILTDGQMVSVRNNVFDATTDGYSFPSGHSQSTGVIFYSFKNEFSNRAKWIIYALVALLVLVPFSRMYLGQHYLTDVLVGSIIGVVAAYLMFIVFEKMGDKEHLYPLLGIPVIVVLLLVFVITKGAYDSYKDLYVAGGGYIGFTVGYLVEKLYVKHNVKTTFLNKVLKVLIGLVGVLVLYVGLSKGFKAIHKESLVLDFLRYGIIALYASLGAPALFKLIFKDKATK